MSRANIVMLWLLHSTTTHRLAVNLHFVCDPLWQGSNVGLLQTVRQHDCDVYSCSFKTLLSS